MYSLELGIRNSESHSNKFINIFYQTFHQFNLCSQLIKIGWKNNRDL